MGFTYSFVNTMLGSKETASWFVGRENLSYVEMMGEPAARMLAGELDMVLDDPAFALARLNGPDRVATPGAPSSFIRTITRGTAGNLSAK